VPAPRFSLLTLTALSLAACSALASPTPPQTPTPAAIPSLTPTPKPRSAELTELKNKVEDRFSTDVPWQLSSEGDTVGEGGGARTGDEARARLNISDGTIIRLAANTEFELTTLSPQPTDPVTKLTLAAGKLWVQLTQALGLGTFEIETPSGSATVRGSLMSAEFFPEDGHMIASCLDGECRLTGASGASVDLEAGEQSEIPGFGQDPTPPQPIDSAQLSDWELEVPEARDLAATITPGPPPTLTPTFTPSPTSTPEPPIAVVGEWTGSTEQGWTVSFRVTEEGQVAEFEVKNIQGLRCGATTFNSSRFDSEIPIADNQFTAGAGFKIAGQFTSPAEATGTFSLDFASPDPNCRFVASGTWTATGP
jgi:hypothetical protein